eukprot:TRINITY_DN223_c0_g1_i5.p1 TRINITY_DN223_c0_g1~~TRINITY_DN223_c0_g1_i5.p1  ORF type:complete len:427 (-),score=121.38 TRINITY_DN223_c0_g1_i5:530-1810(-)
MRLSAENAHNFYVFFFSSRRRHTRSCLVSWARRCVQETEMSRVIDLILCIISLFISVKAIEPGALKIVHPEDFEVTDEKGTKGNKISFNIGNFGRVPWGQDSTGFAYFSNPEDACSSIELKKIFDDEGYSPFLIARRGGCTFVTKAHFAQIHGFRALIIVDNKDENVDYVEMIDDNSGMGTSVDIPTILIGKKVGEELIKKVTELAAKKPAEPVALYLQFIWPKQDKVEYHIWSSSCHWASASFMKEFAEYGKRFEAPTIFKLNFISWPCEDCEEEDKKRCISDGAYCAPDPDGDGPLEGYEAIMEDLRQYCVHQAYPTKYWDYVESFEDCVESIGDKEMTSIADCSNRKLNSLGLDAGKIQACIDGSFKPAKSDAKPDPRKDPNSVFEEFSERYRQRPIVFWPSIIINNMTFKVPIPRYTRFQIF